jgi:hypothetical protein
MRWMVIYEYEVPGGALNLSSTSYPDHGRCGDLPLQGKIPMEEPGIEAGTSWLIVRSSDHQATRLVTAITIKITEKLNIFHHTLRSLQCLH